MALFGDRTNGQLALPPPEPSLEQLIESSRRKARTLAEPLNANYDVRLIDVKTEEAEQAAARKNIEFFQNRIAELETEIQRLRSQSAELSKKTPVTVNVTPAPVIVGVVSKTGDKTVFYRQDDAASAVVAVAEKVSQETLCPSATERLVHLRQLHGCRFL